MNVSLATRIKANYGVVIYLCWEGKKNRFSLMGMTLSTSGTAGQTSCLGAVKQQTYSGLHS